MIAWCVRGGGMVRVRVGWDDCLSFCGSNINNSLAMCEGNSVV
jgi:hypothetical protein